MICLLLAAVILYFVDPFGLDLKVYRLGGQVFSSDPSGLYAPMLGPEGDPGLPFTYPPFAALLFVPLGALPFTAGMLANTLLSLAAAFAVAWDFTPRVRKFLPASVQPWVRPAGIWVLFLLLGPFRDTLAFGQINILLMAACYFAVAKLGFSFATGVVIGLSGGIKLTPLALGLAPLALQRWACVLGVHCSWCPRSAKGNS